MSDTAASSIGKALHKSRISNGLTQAQVAKKAATTVNHYAKIERGEVMPSLKTLEKIIKALEVKSSDILPF